MSDPARLQQLAADAEAAAAQLAQATDMGPLERLRELRLQAVAALLEVPGPVGLVRASALDRIAGACVRAGLRATARTPLEEQRLAECLGRAQGAADTSALAALLLASHAFELEHVPAFDSLPPDTRPLWLKFMFQTPNALQRSSDSERFLAYLRLLCTRMEEQLAESAAPPEDLVQAFLGSGLFIHAYFNELNLRDLMRTRAAILERILEHRGSVLAQLRVLRARPARPRIGFVATHLHDGTETVFLVAHLERLDRRRFDIRLYSVREPDGPLGALCRASAERYVPLPDSAADAVALLRREDLDVAVFCSNLTLYPHTVTQIAAHRVARLQVANGCSPVTTGLRNMDALVQGEANETEESQAHYTERLVRIRGAADCYPFQYMIEGQVPRSASRATLGIPTGAPVYFAAANYYKIVPELSGTWIRILASVPDSHLVLMPFNPYWASNYAWQPLIQRLTSQAAEAAVAPERVRVLSPVATLLELHALMGLADVYLDSFPYSGACSFFDPLWVGLPIVSRRGNVNRSRHGSAILEQEGFPDWVASDEAGYLHRAVELGRNADRRRADRERLLEARQRGLKLLDTADYAARLTPLIEHLLGDWDREVAAVHALEPDQLAERIGKHARELASLDSLFSDTKLASQVVLPYLCSGSRRLLHVGACSGAQLQAFLEQGWQAVLLELGRRDQLELGNLLKKHAGQVRLDTTAGTRAAGLGAYLEDNGLFDLDFVRINTGGRDLETLRALDFTRVSPRLLMAGLGGYPPGGEPERVAMELRHMRECGYRACVICMRAAIEPARAVSRTRLLAVGVDAIPAEARGLPLLGNVLFFRNDDRDFLPSLADWLARHAPP